MIYLEHHSPEKNLHRFYRIIITPSLFGQFALVHEWGRMCKSSQRLERWFDTPEEAKKESERLKEKKRRKGYKSTFQ